MRKPTQFAIAGGISLVLALVSSSVELSPALAQLRDEYTLEQAQTGMINVQVWPGSGTNLDFTSTGQYIYRAWLDDPSRVLLETDTPIDSANAQIIHLRKIDAVEFEGLLATGATLLTVATINTAGQRNLYQFRVSYGDNRPEYATISLMPRTVAPRVDTIPVDSAYGGVDLATFRAGVAQLIREGTIQGSGPMHGRLKTFIALVENGSSPVEAAQTAEINLEVVQEVAQVGLQAAAEEARSRFEDDGDAAPEAVDEVTEPAQRMPLESFDADRLMESIDRVHLLVPDGTDGE